MSMRTDDFDYNLPEELIAQAPAEPRDSCRLLVVDRKGSQAGTPLEHGGTVEHRIFRDIIDYIEQQKQNGVQISELVREGLERLREG